MIISSEWNGCLYDAVVEDDHWEVVWEKPGEPHFMLSHLLMDGELTWYGVAEDISQYVVSFCDDDWALFFEDLYDSPRREASFGAPWMLL